MGVLNSAGRIEKMVFVAISASVKNKLNRVIEDALEEATKEIQEAAKRIVSEELQGLVVKTARDVATGETIITMQIRSK